MRPCQINFLFNRIIGEYNGVVQLVGKKTNHLWWYDAISCYYFQYWPQVCSNSSRSLAKKTKKKGSYHKRLWTTVADNCHSNRTFLIRPFLIQTFLISRFLIQIFLIWRFPIWTFPIWFPLQAALVSGKMDSLAPPPAPDVSMRKKRGRSLGRDLFPDPLHHACEKRVWAMAMGTLPLAPYRFLHWLHKHLHRFAI